MNLFDKKVIRHYQRRYPVGTRVRLLKMDDPHAPPVGMLGTVVGIDDMANLLMKWDNGSTLNVVLGEDQIEKIGDFKD